MPDPPSWDASLHAAPAAGGSPDAAAAARRRRRRFAVLTPLAISVVAVASAAAMSYGTDPRLAQHPWGMNVIMLCRRLQWPLIGLSLILCLVLLGWSLSKRHRVWWLIALAPVLTLYVHRFATGSVSRYAVVEEPAFVTAGEAGFLRDEDYVVGVIFNEQPYAYPFACLYESPVVVQSDREHRLLLMWSPKANAATALAVAPEVKGRQLDIVSDPGDGLLVYNERTGEFICAVTGLTPKRQVPRGVASRLRVTKTTWARWRGLQPETRVMKPTDGSYGRQTTPMLTVADEPSLVIVGSASPLALLPQHVTFAPINSSAGDVPVLVFRDRTTGNVRAFDRRLEADLIPKFKPNTDAKRKGVLFIDGDSNSGWNGDGTAIDGMAKGRKLTPVDVQEDVWDHAARFWYPGLIIHAPPGSPPAKPTG